MNTNSMSAQRTPGPKPRMIYTTISQAAATDVAVIERHGAVPDGSVFVTDEGPMYRQQAPGERPFVLYHGVSRRRFGSLDSVLRAARAAIAKATGSAA